MEEQKMKVLESLLDLTRKEKGKEIIGISVEFWDGTLRVLLSKTADLPPGNISYTRLTYKDGQSNWRKSVFVHGVEYCKLISNEDFQREVE